MSMIESYNKLNNLIMDSSGVAAVGKEAVAKEEEVVAEAEASSRRRCNRRGVNRIHGILEKNVA